MNVMQELDSRLSQWRPEVARRVEQAIAGIIALADAEQAVPVRDATENTTWPNGFFERTAGALADTPLVREQPSSYDARKKLP